MVLPLPEGGSLPLPFPRGPREGTAHTFGRKCPYHCGQQGADGRAGYLDKRFFTLKTCSASSSTERIWQTPKVGTSVVTSLRHPQTPHLCLWLLHKREAKTNFTISHQGNYKTTRVPMSTTAPLRPPTATEIQTTVQ